MIRKACINDLDAIWELRLKTSKLLHDRGIDQWQSKFPTIDQFRQDIIDDEFYVLTHDEKIVAMMALKKGIEPTYHKIYDGQWHFDEPYMTIHRIAVDHAYSGLGYGLALLAFAKQQAIKFGYYYMRIDTHEENQAAIKRFTSFGFMYCGYILLSKDHPTTRKRLAYDYRWE